MFPFSSPARHSVVDSHEMDTPVQPTGAIAQRPTPEVPGSVEVKMFPPASSATHKVVLGHDTASIPMSPSTSDSFQTEAPPDGSVEVKMSPLWVTATQRFAPGHDSPEISLGTPYSGTGCTDVSDQVSGLAAAGVAAKARRIAPVIVADNAAARNARSLITFERYSPRGVLPRASVRSGPKGL